MRLLHNGAWWSLCLVGFFALTADGLAGNPEAKLEAMLIWGTNGGAPTNATLKPVEPEVLRKLKKMPFKWGNYYEVNQQPIALQGDKESKVRMSKDCEIVVRAGDGEAIELKLYGQGKLVGQISQRLPKGELLVVGGDAENFTSWFVVLRRAE